ncbi:hypothetical protein J560_2140 [Acinetobacter baumannii 855125]|nr:hypothetical protein J560_2140 [Acinetobacter baumannii 855125]
MLCFKSKRRDNRILFYFGYPLNKASLNPAINSSKNLTK